MAKNWTNDQALLDAITRNLFNALPLLPKRLVRVDMITHRYQMPFSQIQILCMLTDGSMTIGQISAALGIAKPNITPLLDSLKERGLLERVRSEKDRRIVDVALLPAGMEMARQIKDSISEQVTTWEESLSAGDAKRLNNALATLIRMSKLLSDE
ncbi:MAG: MarR family winged helix-turn-helix transcriptional regulator [Aristaeellaceae bacterium]